MSGLSPLNILMGISNYDDILVGDYKYAVMSQQHLARKTLANRHVTAWLLLSQAGYG